MPHTEFFAASLSDAAGAIESLHSTKDHRVRTRQRGQRIVLVIDELAELARLNDTMRLLASILAIGRSKSINVIAATQKPLGLVHRDISPQNILVSRAGEVKVTDFGVATASTHQTKTRTGVLKGKFAYMSPEQARGERGDCQTPGLARGLVLS